MPIAAMLLWVGIARVKRRGSKIFLRLSLYVSWTRPANIDVRV